ncbi:MAG: CPBP family intramembrane metalloprotease [Chlamydiales bacterium]|nr:CPBP family intramembrane metalloprotease [Chlamydiales bacterium]
MQLASLYFEYIELSLVFGLIAFGLHRLAKAKGFYLDLSSRHTEKIPLKLTSVILVFAIYLVMTLGISSLFAQIIRSLYAIEHAKPSFAAMGWLQLTIVLSTLFLFYLYSRTLPSSVIGKMIKNPSCHHASIPWDIFMGLLTWVISFPLVIAIGQFTDMLLYLTTGFESYEQVAVRYLKMALSSPQTLSVALFTILIGAPAIEEFLFRGFLQTYLKRWMSIRWAIILSSLG